ncbi:MAG: monovalent cation/H(+) antiporter subunit G [Gammaproteobacteria bacterium]|nr:monovalent cation/H(+) antiporter subunit G [Gammaproteobacteria bacterium]
MDIIGAILLLGGASFLFLGSLGLIRMPDVYNRIQAGTKATTLGTLLVLLGTALIQPQWSLKLLLIGVFLLFTNPLSSQVLANAAHRSKVRKSELTSIDDLEADREQQS